MKNILFEKAAFEDIAFWIKTDVRMMKKIIQLLENIQQTPFEGLGKPEALKHQLQGNWSRRIDAEHRLVYRIEDAAVIVVSCRFHYS
jgi:toxin YoeB